jgi:hypothetical protein
VKVVNSNILDCSDLLKGSDVVILNNVFQWFIPPAEQVKLLCFYYLNFASFENIGA